MSACICLSLSLSLSVVSELECLVSVNKVECLETERSNGETEDDEKEQCQKRLECYEKKMRDLEKRLMERTKQVDEAKECYRSLRQELHQFNIRLDCTRKRSATTQTVLLSPLSFYGL